MEPLRGHVADRADDVAGVRQVVALDRLGQPEVGDPDGALSVEQKVGGLDVAVEDTLRWAYSRAPATCSPTRATLRQ